VRKGRKIAISLWSRSFEPIDRGRENRSRGVTAEMKAENFSVNAGGTAEYSPCVSFGTQGGFFFVRLSGIFYKMKE
jgi:hypothetical protein